MPIRVIPVLDLKCGRAVRAVGGAREHYSLLRTRFHADSDPLGVARGYRDALNLRELYLADLDAISGKAPDLALYEAIRALGVDLWVDAGIRDRTMIAPLLEAGVSTLVVGLETVREPSALAGIVSDVAPERLVFSLDLRGGHPVIGGDREAWGTTDPFTLAGSVIAIGIRRLLLLDLARVGTGGGIGTLPLAARLGAADPGLEITLGGGIADRHELRALSHANIHCVLIGSALHDGRIDQAVLAEYIR